MATQVQRRRGTTAQHAGFTGAAGELSVDTSKNVVVVHDGSTAGGFPQPSLSNVQNSTYITLTSVAGTNTITAGAPDPFTALVDGQEFSFIAAGTNTGAVTLNIDSVGAVDVKKNGGTALVAGDITSGAFIKVKYVSATGDFEMMGGASSSTATANPSINGFRLTLTSSVPVTMSDVTAATTIYCTPYKGNQISLYSGGVWVTRTSSEFSLALGTLTSAKPYDVFCYDNSGTPTLEFLVWTNDTTRATALAYQDGILSKSGDTTRRYLGTFYTTSTTTTEDSDSKRLLWNYSNRVQRLLRRKESTGSWTYGTAAWRYANNSSANRLDFILGVAEDSVSFLVDQVLESNTAGVVLYSGVGLDSTSGLDSSYARGAVYQAEAASKQTTITAFYKGIVSAGFHYAAWLEYGSASGVNNFYGTTGGAIVVSGISGEIFA